MNNYYTPDRWVMIEINSKENGKIRKILASYYGGFAGSDSWKLSSGNTSVIDKGEFYEFPQESGSAYKCYKTCIGMSNYTSGVYAGWIKALSDMDNSATSIEIVEDYETTT